MTELEKKQLAEAALPLVVLCNQIKLKPYKEMTLDFQNKLCESLWIIENLIFQKPRHDAKWLILPDGLESTIN